MKKIVTVTLHTNGSTIITRILNCYNMELDGNLPYLSVLNLGSNTRRGSNIRRVVHQNERNKHQGPFKRRVPKLGNLINLKRVPDVKEN